MLKKVLKTVAWLAVCILAISPAIIVYMMAWTLLSQPGIAMKLTGILVATIGIILTPFPAKTTYFIIREVWDSNFTWEFNPPPGT